VASTTALTTIFKSDILAGAHAPADVYKIALFTSTATWNSASTVYVTTNEVTGTGYTAGGATLSTFATGSSGTTAWLDFTVDPTWTTATFTCASCIIYNTSKTSRILAVIDFGGNSTVSAGTFTIVLPVADATTGLIRLT
jgi:hypothetical protein